MSSPFTSYANTQLRFQVASGALTPDSKGNLRPGKAVLEVSALLQQKRDPNRELRPGVDTSAVWTEGYITAIAGQDNLVLPSIVTVDSVCSATWQGRQGRFFLEFTARNPYIAALGIDLVEKIRGYFQPSSFVVSGEPWSPSPTPTPSADNLQPNRELLTITSAGQSTFTLRAAVIAPELSELYLNGVKATYGTEYTINSTQLVWLITSLPLQPSDEFEILYYTQPS